MTTDKATLAHIEILIGSPVQYDSERKVLKELFDILSKEMHSAVILTNISLAGRQIDFVVALDNLALVIEAKGYNRPIRGGENGPWQVQVASGDWTDFRNPYVQARDAALAVRDALRSFAGTEVRYPAAALIFTPDIPHGSQVYPGDFKVSVMGLAGLRTALQKQQDEAWPLNQWREFARHLRLTQVATVAAACDLALAEAEELMRRYTAAFRRTYTNSDSLVPFTCKSDKDDISSEDVVRLVSEEYADILIQGPSGCGKSLLAAYAGLKFGLRDGLTIMIPARDYAASIKACLDRETGLLGSPSAATLLNAARRLNKHILFVVDGYNECREPERYSLIRGLAELARRYQATVLVTSQIPLDEGDLLALHTINVPPATTQTKVTIARMAAGGASLTREIEDILGAIGTGLEAKIVGELSQQLSSGSSRYALFDAFTRRRLGGASAEGIRSLSKIAGWLSDRIAFSMSVRDLDRLADAKHVPQSLIGLLHTSSLLVRRGDRVAFIHELFFDAFAAEEVIRRARGRAEAVLEALATPQHASRRGLIIGAIDDDLLLEQVLEGVAEAASVADCLSGSCGIRAKEWAETRCQDLLGKLRDEARNVRFLIRINEWGNVAFEKDLLTIWNSTDRAFLAALPQMISEGRCLDDVLEIVGILDLRIGEERLRLRNEARQRNVALRSSLFAISYVFQFSNAPGITQVCARLHAGLFPSFLRGTKGDTLVGTIKGNMARDDLSAGQLYFILPLWRLVTSVQVSTARLIGRAIKTYWTESPYHLRLDLMNAAAMCGRAGEADRATLIETIESLPRAQHPFLSTAMLEALQSLGAFEDGEREHHEMVREKIRQCLAHKGEDDGYAMAYCIYSAQFDHPYSGAYCEVVSDLSYHERMTLLMMAAKGASDSLLFLSPLLVELASFGDQDAGESVVRWAALPPADSFMPQEAVTVFVVAHIALARLGCPLPDRELMADAPSAEALSACGAILYWSNRTDLDENMKRIVCRDLLSQLAQHGQDAALDAIWCCEQARSRDLKRLGEKTPVEQSLVDRFPTEVVGVCRRSLHRPDRQIGYFIHFSNHDRRQNLMFAIDVLARHGNSTDLALLRRYSPDPALGTSAIAAVKKIEERLASM